MKSKTRRNIIVGSAATLTGLAVAGVTTSQTNAQQSAPATAPSPTGRFNGKVVLITGATSGIGRATAFAFAREGAKVVFCGRRVNLGEQVATEIKQEGGEALYVQADVLKSADIEALVATTVKTYGRLDIAFNNAGVVANAPIHETPEEEWDRIVGTNRHTDASGGYRRNPRRKSAVCRRHGRSEADWHSRRGGEGGALVKL